MRICQGERDVFALEKNIFLLTCATLVACSGLSSIAIAIIIICHPTDIINRWSVSGQFSTSVVVVVVIKLLLLLLLDSSLNRHFDGESICSFAPAPANASAIPLLGKMLRGRTTVNEDELEELPVFVLSQTEKSS